MIKIYKNSSNSTIFHQRLNPLEIFREKLWRFGSQGSFWTYALRAFEIQSRLAYKEKPGPHPKWILSPWPLWFFGYVALLVRVVSGCVKLFGMRFGRALDDFLLKWRKQKFEYSTFNSWELAFPLCNHVPTWWLAFCVNLWDSSKLIWCIWIRSWNHKSYWLKELNTCWSRSRRIGEFTFWESWFFWLHWAIVIVYSFLSLPLYTP